MSELVVTIRDYSKELSRTRVNVTPLTAANFDAENTALDALSTAIAGIIIGVVSKDEIISDIRNVSASVPSAKAAQRETKWLVKYHDTVNGKFFRNEIACADQSLLSGNSDVITTFPSGVLGTFKTQWEANVLSPYGNAVALDSLELVGKRL